MGFTTLEGAIMGTRAGDHDAALDFYVMQKESYSPKEMDTILNKKSVILGIIGMIFIPTLNILFRKKIIKI